MGPAAHCINLDSLASFLGFAPQNLFFLIENADRLYSEIKIPKRGSVDDFRTINIPCSELKGVQRAILRLILQSGQASRHVYAYVTGRSVVDAARKLCGKQAVLKLDLKEFFPSIINKRVFGLFRRMGFNNIVSQMLTRICSYQGRLCQGAPTSPHISNLIFRTLDNYLSCLANKWALNYLRYSDDLFSFGPSDFRYRVFVGYVNKIVRENGFSINTKKTSYSPIGSPRFTLGLATHGAKPSLPRKDRKNYRAAFFKASRNLKWARENLEKLTGMAEWHRAIYGTDDLYNEYQKIIKNVRSIKLHDHYTV